MRREETFSMLTTLECSHKHVRGKITGEPDKNIYCTFVIGYDYNSFLGGYVK